MSLPQAIDRCTPEEYLRREQAALEKHEYYNGMVYRASDGPPTPTPVASLPSHSLVVANVIGELRSRLKGDSCRVFDSNLRVRVPRTTSYTCPDATVAHIPLQFDA